MLRRRALACAGITAVVGLTAGIAPPAGAHRDQAAPAPGAGPPVAAGGGIRVVELPGLGGGPAFVNDINDRGQAIGDSIRPDGAYHSVLWDDGEVIDLTPDLPPPPATSSLPASNAVAINDRGQVAGTLLRSATPASAETDVWLWDDGELTTLTPGPSSAGAVEVNARGQVLYNRVVGASPTTQAEAVVWDDGEVTPAPPTADGKPFWGLAMNDRGVVVGGSMVALQSARAHRWEPGDAPVDLGALGGDVSIALAVNDWGVVVGNSRTADGDRRAFRRHRGEMIELAPLGGDDSQVNAFVDGRPQVNSWGHVAGRSKTAAGELHATLWRGDGPVDLGTLGGGRSIAYAVNDWGQVIGRSRTADGEFHAFLWQNGRMVDLTELVGGGEVTLRAINNRGQVVASVERDGEPTRSYMWEVPVLWGRLPAATAR